VKACRFIITCTFSTLPKLDHVAANNISDVTYNRLPLTYKLPNISPWDVEDSHANSQHTFQQLREGYTI